MEGYIARRTDNVGAMNPQVATMYQKAQRGRPPTTWTDKLVKIAGPIVVEVFPGILFFGLDNGNDNGVILFYFFKYYRSSWHLNDAKVYLTTTEVRNYYLSKSIIKAPLSIRPSPYFSSCSKNLSDSNPTQK